MAKLTEYTAATRFDSGDILIKDGTGGTKKIKVSNAAVEFAGLVSAIQHRNVYRGKSLGSSITSTQKSAIQDGTFDDLFIGDYWTIGNVSYVIADMDYWYKCGDTNFTTHHLVMVPSATMYSAQMNSTNITTGGYTGSEMYTTNLETAKTTISSAFGDMLLTHREYLTNAVTDGHASGGAWFDSTVDLMNEIMVYGCHVYTPANNGTTIPNNYTVGKTQLALFRLSPRAIDIRAWYWLRDVVSATTFAGVNGNGGAACGYASSSIGVRPVFAIG